MSIERKLKVSKAMVYLALLVFCFSGAWTVCCAADAGGITVAALEGAEHVARMSDGQLHALITICSLAALVLVVRYHVKCQMEFQTSVSDRLTTMTEVLRDIQNDQRKRD